MFQSLYKYKPVLMEKPKSEVAIFTKGFMRLIKKLFSF